MLRSGFCDEASRIAAGRCFAHQPWRAVPGKPAQHDKFLSSGLGDESDELRPRNLQLH